MDETSAVRGEPVVRELRPQTEKTKTERTAQGLGIAGANGPGNPRVPVKTPIPRGEAVPQGIEGVVPSLVKIATKPPEEKSPPDQQGSLMIEGQPHRVSNQTVLTGGPTALGAKIYSSKDLPPPKGLPVMVNGHRYWAKGHTDRGQFILQLSSRKWWRWREAGTIVFNSEGQITSICDAHQKKLDSLTPELTECLEAYSQRLDTMSKLKADLLAQIKGCRGRDAEALSGDLVKRWASQWRGCVSESFLPRRVFRQTSGIPGLKVMGKRGSRVAEISLSVLGSGTYKKAKGVLRITPEGEVINLARYTKTKKDEETVGLFETDIKHELKIRRKFFSHGIGLEGEMSNAHLYDSILRLDSYSSHISKTTKKETTRYVAEQAQGNLMRCVYEDAEGQHPRSSLDERMVAIHGCVGALRGLRLIHARRYVHRDVKLENILMVHGKGKLADFGTCVGQGVEATQPRGSSFYMPPELSFKAAKEGEDPSMDMFSFGSMLLEILDPEDLGRKLLYANDDAWDRNIDLPHYKKQITEIQSKLKDENSSLRKQITKKYGLKAAEVLELIAELIDYDPKNRPTSTEAEQVLQRFERLLPPIPA